MLYALIGVADGRSQPQNIRLVLPFGPGGLTDQLARSLQNQFNRQFSRNLLIENKVGGAGSAGLTFLQSAKPDGTVISLIPVTGPRFSRVLLDDLEVLGSIGRRPYIFYINSADNTKSFSDFIKKNSKQIIKIGIFSRGFPGLISKLNKVTEQKFAAIKFRESSAMIGALLSDEVDALIAPFRREIIERSGLKPILVFSRSRLASLPDVATAVELGYDLRFSTLYVVAAPKGIPDDVGAPLFKDIAKVANTNEFRKNAERDGGTIVETQSSEKTKLEIKMAGNDFCDDCKAKNICDTDDECKEECDC